MLHPSTKRLIDKLDDMTAQRRIDWTEGESNTYIFDAEGYRVALTGEPVEFVLSDPLGNELERTGHTELSSEQTNDGRSYADLISALRGEARRIARGTEHAIDRVLAGLDQVGAATTAPLVDQISEDVAADAGEPEAQTDETEIANAAFADEDVGAAVQQLADKVNGLPTAVETAPAAAVESPAPAIPQPVFTAPEPEPAPAPVFAQAPPTLPEPPAAPLIETPAEAAPAPQAAAASGFTNFGTLGGAVTGAAAATYGASALVGNQTPSPAEPQPQPEPDVPNPQTSGFVPAAPSAEPEAPPSAPSAPDAAYMSQTVPGEPAGFEAQTHPVELVEDTVMPVIEDESVHESAFQAPPAQPLAPPSARNEPLSAAEAELAISNAVDVSTASEAVAPAPQPAANAFSSFSSFGSPGVAFGRAPTTPLPPQVSDTGESAVDAATSAVEEANDSIQNAFGNVAASAQSTVQSSTQAASDAVTASASAMTPDLPDTLDAAASTLGQAPDALGQMTQDAAAQVTNVATDAAEQVTETAGSFADEAGQAFADTGNAIVETAAESAQPVPVPEPAPEPAPEGEVKPATRFNPWN